MSIDPMETLILHFSQFMTGKLSRDEWKTLKDLQQDPERMEKEKNQAFDTLLEQNPHLDDVYFYAFRDTMRDLEKKENTTYYAFRIDFGNGSIWNEYNTEEAQQVYDSLNSSQDPMQTASQQFHEHGRFECSVPVKMPTPPEEN